MSDLCLGCHTAISREMDDPFSLHGKLVSTAFDRPMARYTYATDRQPDAKPIADHIVLVIDESVSHDYFSRVVLPRIRASNSAWRVHDFGLATSMSNCSMATNVMLPAGVSAQATGTATATIRDSRQPRPFSRPRTVVRILQDV